MASNEGYQPSQPEGGKISLGDNNNIVEAIIDYIATTPQNINYNMLREMLRALYNEEDHPYFEYYANKMGLKKKDDDGIPGPGGMATDTGANTGD